MEVKYLYLVAVHILMGFLLYYFDFFPSVYFYAVIGYFMYQIFAMPRAKKTMTVLAACCYITGAEIIFRMTDGGVFYESSKYFIIFYLIIGIALTGLSNKGYAYMLILFFLVPSIVVGAANIGFDSNLRSNIAFVLSGPVCLAISALYCYNKRVSVKELTQLVQYIGYPIITLTTYLFLYTPSIKEVVTGTQSNFATSGGFGPNQVATALGLGMFVFCVNYFMNSKSVLLKLVNALLFALVTFRGIVTFSRGGIFTGILMILAFLVLLYFKSGKRYKSIIIGSTVALLVTFSITWIVSSQQTSGLIDKRYANQDKSGRDKEDLSTGRVDLFLGELEGFTEHPFLGVGASGMKERRKEILGRGIATHNELSRLLSEHGIFGIFILIILLLKPFDMRRLNKHNIFFYAFLVFWFGTINHSAMRIAAPGFIYAMALLNVQNEKKYRLHRKRSV